MKPLHQIFLFILILFFFTLLFSGCSDSSLARWQLARDSLKKDLIATTQQIPALEQEIETLPDGPAREQAMEALAKAKSLVPELAARIDSLDQIIVAARTGDASNLGASIGGLLVGVPVIGPDAGMIGLLAGMGWGIYQRLKRAKEVDDAASAAGNLRDHLTNVIQSIEQAGPEWSEQDKAAIRAIQGPATTKIVGELKNELAA